MRPAQDEEAGDRISVRHEIDPGSRVTDAVEVRNFGAEPATFRIYASDGVVGDSGAFDVLGSSGFGVRRGSSVTALVAVW
ncbi:hypothetical protein [Ruania albidiflava]|uniref:hypothetical protein n=1 Tax=Ruania albidiflava TaxID=366586 RepID=UPI0012FA2504|nr:hypothetical protein [Ruania albidiflava]